MLGESPGLIVLNNKENVQLLHNMTSLNYRTICLIKSDILFGHCRHDGEKRKLPAAELYTANILYSI